MNPNADKYVQSGAEAPKDPIKAHEEAHGTYSDATDGVPTDQRLPTAQMPKGPDKTPFMTK